MRTDGMMLRSLTGASASGPQLNRHKKVGHPERASVPRSRDERESRTPGVSVKTRQRISLVGRRGKREKSVACFEN